MTDKIKVFKEYVESIVEQNNDSCDAVELLPEFDYSIYNKAVRKINNYYDHSDDFLYKVLFTEDELLSVSIMYACIVTGAIESRLTEKLRLNWQNF